MSKTTCPQRLSQLPDMEPAPSLLPGHGREAASPAGSGAEAALGVPHAKRSLSVLDCAATVVSLLCLAAAIAVIHPDLPYAVQLGTNNQLAALGFLLGVMNQCVQRVLPFLFILTEARSGHPTLQNFQGLLGLSPLSKQLAKRWRFSLVVMQATPLVLGVLYKQFSDGFTATPETTIYDAVFAPVAPPGLIVGGTFSERYGPAVPRWNAVLANFTAPFLDATGDDTVGFPPENTVYGFNTVLLSKTSVASIDAPTSSRVLALRESLDSGSSLRLTGRVRGTVAQFNTTVGDEEYWEKTYPTNSLALNYISYGFGHFILHAGLAADDSPRAWNGSWVLIGTMGLDVLLPSMNWDEAGREFLKHAMRFDIKRHNCTGTWKITRSSVELISGGCDPEPLDPAYQYYSNCQLSLEEILGRSIADYLGVFATLRNGSSWVVPTNAAVVAAAFQAITVASEGYVPIQVNGPIWLANNVSNYYNETYTQAETTSIVVPTLRTDWKLYIILVLQPALTILVLFVVYCLYHTPISRDFGLVALIAGVDKDSLGSIRGAGFSGTTSCPVRLGITVSDPKDEGTEGIATVSYMIDGDGVKGSAKHGQIYG